MGPCFLSDISSDYINNWQAFSKVSYKYDPEVDGELGMEDLELIDLLKDRSPMDMDDKTKLLERLKDNPKVCRNMLPIPWDYLAYKRLWGHIERALSRHSTSGLDLTAIDKILQKDNMEKRRSGVYVCEHVEEASIWKLSVLYIKWIVFPTKDLKKGNSIVLAINSFGAHFIKRDPSTCLHSVEMKDIKQYESSGNKLAFNMLVEDAMHEFAFETKQAEEIIVALKTHIQDQMNRRGTKASSADSDVSHLPDASVCDLNQDIPIARKKKKNQDSLEEKEADIKVKELTSELKRCVNVIASYVAVSDEWVKKFSALCFGV